MADDLDCDRKPQVSTEVLSTFVASSAMPTLVDLVNPKCAEPLHWDLRQQKAVDGCRTSFVVVVVVVVVVVAVAGWAFALDRH